MLSLYSYDQFEDPLPGQPGLAEGDFIVAIEGAAFRLLVSRTVTPRCRNVWFFGRVSAGSGYFMIHGGSCRRPSRRCKLRLKGLTVSMKCFAGCSLRHRSHEECDAVFSERLQRPGFYSSDDLSWLGSAVTVMSIGMAKGFSKQVGIA